MDLLALADALEAGAKALREHAARDTATGQLPLESPWIEWAGGEQPPDTYGKAVDVVLRDGYAMTGPASALTWEHGFEPLDGSRAGVSDIVRYRISAEQPDE